MKPQPDLRKVEAAVEAIEARRRARIPDYRAYPPKPSPVAQDAALRKKLRAHGRPCPGFNCHHFLNRD